MSLTTAQALDALESDDLIGLGMEADALRRRLHPEGVVTYTVAVSIPAAVSPEQLGALLHRADRTGATDFVLEPGPTSLEACEALLTRLRHDVPTTGRHGLTATDLLRLSAHAALPVAEILRRLQAAGLDSLSGDDAFLLTDAYRPAELCSSADWLALHRTAHALGIPSTASMTFGLGEDHADRVVHLGALAALEAETSGFTAFTLHAWSPTNPSPDHRTLDEATAVDYLKTLAIARLTLEFIPHLQADPAQGLKVTQMALRFGANDAGPVLTDERAAALAGPSNCASEEELRRIIRDAGFLPVQRDHLYRTVYLI